MVYYVSFTGIKKKNETNKKKKTKTRQNKKRKKTERKKADKQNKQKTTPNIYIVPGVGLKDFIFLPKIVCKER
jgi:hypothetical protein